MQENSIIMSLFSAVVTSDYNEPTGRNQNLYLQDQDELDII